MPFFVLGGILNSVVEIISNIRHLYVAVIKLKRINNILEVTREEIDEEELDHTCVVCQDEIDHGKLLECKHVFHLKCLKKWVLNENSCPSCKREDVIFVPDDKLCAFKHKIMTKRRLLKAGIQKEDFIDDIEGVNTSNEQNAIIRYAQIEKQYLRRLKKKNRKDDDKLKISDLSESDSEDTDKMIQEVSEVERKINQMMAEIAKARMVVEKYDKKLTRRLQKKQRIRQEEREKRRREAEEKNVEQEKDPYEDVLDQEIDNLLSNKAQKDRDEEEVMSDKDKNIQKRMETLSKALGLKEAKSVSSDTIVNKKAESKSVRLKDFDVSPDLRPLSSHPAKPKFSDNEPKLNFGMEDEGDENEEMLNDANEDLHSAPDMDSSKNVLEKLQSKKYKLIESNVSVVSQNDEEVKKIMKPEFSQFMNMTHEKGRIEKLNV